LPALALLRKPLSGLANRRLQPGTLGEIKPKFNGNINIIIYGNTKYLIII